MNALDEVNKIERELTALESERVKVLAANERTIQAEQNRKYFDADRQAEAVRVLRAKRDTVIQALDRIRERKSAELQTARADLAVLQARQNDELEKQSAKTKERARLAFIQSGGLPADFESQWPAILAARAVKKIDEPKTRAFKQGF